ncbi:pyridoxal phosphate-dependent aminotransferase [Saccharopolyspora sp. NPDC002686]|uniref:pyridoxal phosphate-dependent aminotransferase n=1 Tax=Saccharopolyspora sp. NPDC002686 TaxID=3154541 RepID=UPI00331BE2DF
MIKHSATLAVNEKISALRAAGKPVLHLGFGEAGLPVLPEIGAELASAAGQNAYGPVVGSASARASVAGYFTRRDLPTDPEQAILAPGSKALLYAALAALPGDLVLPTPSWVTYAAQAALVGKRVIGVPVPGEAGGVPDPALLEPALAAARREGADPKLLVLTLPDNPTGTAAGADLVKAVCEIADRHGLVIISDEIYRDLTYVPEAHLSPASLLPERTIVTGGLSKSTALGGWRVGFARMPAGELGRSTTERIVGIASEIWSSLAMPMQAAAEFVLSEPTSVTDHVAACRRLHAAVSSAVHSAFVEAGAECRTPSAAFYVYPDFEQLRPELTSAGIRTGAELADALLDNHGVGVLAGEHFGDTPSAYRFRVASSLLYGETEDQRWQALRSENPVELPWIADALDRLRTALRSLV